MMTAIEVRRSGAVTVIGPDGPSAAGPVTVVRLGLSGGTLITDVRDATAIPTVEVSDADAASWWLFSLYGREAADRILQFAQSQSSGGEDDADGALSLDFDPPESTTAGHVRRLALALWLRRWWPTTSEQTPELREWLLDAEAGALGFALEDMLDRRHDVAVRLLEPHALRIAVNLFDHNARAGGSPADERIDAVLVDAAVAALEVGDPDAEGMAVLSDAERAVRDSDAEVHRLRAALDDELGFAALVELMRVERSRPVADEMAFSAGGGDVLTGGRADAAQSDGVVRGRAPVDPRSVPARVFSAADDAITWTMRALEGRVRCDVTVALASAAPLASEYSARVEVGGRTASVVLTQDDDLLYARCELDGDPSGDELLVSVFASDGPFGSIAARPTADRRRDRDEIAAVVQSRAQAARSGPRDGWDAPFAAELAFAATVAVL